MSGVSSIEFASLARTLSMAARVNGATAPTFRSPPRNSATRSIRRSGDQVVVSVSLRNRTEDEVVGDMVEGIIRTNGYTGSQANALRACLFDALAGNTHTNAA